MPQDSNLWPVVKVSVFLCALCVGCGDSPSATARDSGGTDDGEVVSFSTSPGVETDAGAEQEPFAGFILSHSFRPCPIDNGDCAGSTELTSARVLRVDRAGEGPDMIHAAVVSQEDFSSATKTLADSGLRALLGGADPLCPTVADVVESMTLEVGDATLSKTTTECEQEPLAAVRTELQRLVDKYLPTCGDAVVIAMFDQCRKAEAEQDCTEAGGLWQPPGNFPWGLCVCPTGQKGCACENSKDCVNSKCSARPKPGGGRCDDVEYTCDGQYPAWGCSCHFDTEGKASVICLD